MSFEKFCSIGAEKAFRFRPWVAMALGVEAALLIAVLKDRAEGGGLPGVRRRVFSDDPDMRYVTGPFAEWLPFYAPHMVEILISSMAADGYLFMRIDNDAIWLAVDDQAVRAAVSAEMAYVIGEPANG